MREIVKSHVIYLLGEWKFSLVFVFFFCFAAAWRLAKKRLEIPNENEIKSSTTTTSAKKLLTSSCLLVIDLER